MECVVHPRVPSQPTKGRTGPGHTLNRRDTKRSGTQSIRFCIVGNVVYYRRPKAIHTTSPQAGPDLRLLAVLGSERRLALEVGLPLLDPCVHEGRPY